VCGSVLYFAAVFAVCCSVLRCVAVCCGVLQCNVDSLERDALGGDKAIPQSMLLLILESLETSTAQG